MNAAAAAAELGKTLDAARPGLAAISEDAAAERSAGDKWSKKEILGHLIDSASNNHQRFVRLQHESLLVMPAYHQSDWVRTQNYQDRPWRELVELWLAYNRHLAHVIRHADTSAAGHIWRTPDKDYTLEFLIQDYLVHLRHQLTQIVGTSAVV